MEIVKLLEPITINGLKIPNRTVMPSMGMAYTSDYTLDLELKDTNGETVSIVHGVWQIRKIPEGMESPFPAG